MNGRHMHASELHDAPATSTGKRNSAQTFDEPAPPWPAANNTYDPKTDRGPSRTGFWNGTIRRRLAGILAIPVLALLVVMGLSVLNQVRDYQSAAEVTQAVHRELAIQAAIHELERERGLTTGLLGGDAAFRPQLTAQRPRLDAAVAALQQAIGPGASPTQAAIRAALGPLTVLPEMRGEVDGHRADRTRMFDFFSARIQALESVDLGLAQSPDRQLRRTADTLSSLGKAKDAAAAERGFLNGVFSAGAFRPGEYGTFMGRRSDKLRWLDTFFAEALPRHQASGRAALTSAYGVLAARLEDQAMLSNGVRPVQVDPPSWWTANTHVIDALRDTQIMIGRDLVERAQSLQHTAVVKLSGLGALALVSVAGAAALVVMASRSITTPLARLAVEADDVASRRLPDLVALVQSGEPVKPPPPVAVSPRAGAEIRSVADALDRLQSAACELAAEQVLLRHNTSESLANLGRRNQNLLRRQIGFITQLEREEADPSALADLFELDHLATRMRRNAESLLLLVGESGPRSWSTPLPIADVIRAATSEVEQYRRVMLRRMDDALLNGSVVSDVAHMLAELLENALAFSPPDTEVEVHGRRLATGYLIVVLDHGVGMTPEELARANARLTGEETFLVAPTRFLGHYVVAHLAQRLGAEVTVTPSPVSGVTARITLPAEVLATVPQVSADRDGGGRPGPGPAPGGLGGSPTPPPPPPLAPSTTPPPLALMPAAHFTLPEPRMTVTGRSLTVTETHLTVSGPASSPATTLGIAIPQQSDTPPSGMTRRSRQLPEGNSPSPHGSTGPVAEPAAIPGAAIPGAGDPASWTRNGLPKRVPRAKGTKDTQPPQTVSEPRAWRPQASAPAPAASRNPAEVSTMLTQFRAGVHRGESEQAARETGSIRATGPISTQDRDEDREDR